MWERAQTKRVDKNLAEIGAKYLIDTNKKNSTTLAYRTENDARRKRHPQSEKITISYLSTKWQGQKPKRKCQEEKITINYLPTMWTTADPTQTVRLHLQ